MTLYGQPNSWQCGPFALKHALLSYGVFAHEDDLAEAAGSSTTRGTDERRLDRAARLFGFELGLIRRTSPRAARRELADHLIRRIPVLLCLDQWEHWVTVAGADEQSLVVYDSHYDTVLRLEPWEAMLERLGFRERGWQGLWSRTLFDLHPLISRRGDAPRVALTPERAAYLLREENADLRRSWDEYLGRILAFCDDEAEQLELGIGLAQWLEDIRPAVLQEAMSRFGAEAASSTEQVLDRFAFAAQLCSAQLRPDAEGRARAAVWQAVIEHLPRRAEVPLVAG